VQLRDFPQDIVDAARTATVGALDDLAAKDQLSAEAVASFRAASKHLNDWSSVSIKQFLAARG